VLGPLVFIVYNKNIVLKFSNIQQLRNYFFHKHENEADLYLVWILQSWFILLTFGMQKYEVWHNRQWT
jgi:hypothetical protein